MAGDLEEIRRRAEQAAEVGRWDEDALALNEALLSDDPNDIAAAQRKARCLEVLGDFQAARDLYGWIVDHRSHRGEGTRVNIVRLERWLEARKRVEEIVLQGGAEKLRRRVNRAKENSAAYRFRLEGRRWLLSAEGSAFDYLGYGRELRQVARELDADDGDRADLLDRALNAYRKAIQLDASSNVRHSALTGAAAVFLDQGNPGEARRLSEIVLNENPEDKHAPKTRLAAEAMLEKARRRRQL